MTSALAERHDAILRASRNAGANHPILVVAVKALHTTIFMAELSSILWLVATGLAGRRDRTVALAAGAVAVEAAVFVANGGVCPLTPLTERLGAASGSVSDIFLPAPIARTIPIWSTALVLLAAVLHARAARLSRSPDRFVMFRQLRAARCDAIQPAPAVP